jgi:hypothetical protein
LILGAASDEIMPSAQGNKKEELTREERRQRRLLRREKQRKDNFGRAAKMHASRLQLDRGDHGKAVAGLKASAYVGCSGWFYWKWRGLFIQMTCRQVNGFVITRSTFIRLKSTLHFIHGRPWQT